MNRYNRTGLINGGTSYGTPRGVQNIRTAVSQGRIICRPYVTSGVERLDIIAARELGRADLWWVLASTSGIGWGLQVPPGTRLLLPIRMSDVSAVVG